jgi:TolB protein
MNARYWRCGPAALALLVLCGCHTEPVSTPAASTTATPQQAAVCTAPSGGRCVAVVAVNTVPGPLAEDARQRIERDLVRGGGFAALAPAAFPEHPGWEQKIGFDAWRALGVDTLVLVGAADAKAAALRVVAVDTHSQTVLLANDSSLPPAPNHSPADQAADLIVQRVTGVRGLAGTAIAYISVAMAGGSPLYRLNVSNPWGDDEKVLAESRQPLMSPAWSPDGLRLAYVGYEGDHSAVYIRNMLTGAVTRVVAEPGINGSPAWSPDGQHLAVTLSFGHNPDIYIIDVATGARRRITSDSAIETEAAWSPDGRTIAFTSDRGGPARVYTMNTDGSGVRMMPPFGKQTSNPCYSPDGKTLAIVVDEGRDSRIGLLRLDSGTFDFISAGPRDEKPSFAPNGAMLLYASEDARRGQIKIRGFDGFLSEVHGDEDVREPSWSPYLD